LSDRQRHQCRGRVKFRLTSRTPFVLFVRITENQSQFTPDMKKLFVLSMLMAFAMLCSCQKQNSAAEQQLAQRKAELDARQNALDEREKALIERERAVAKAQTVPADAQSRRLVRDPAQMQAERDRRIQQLPPELQGLVANSEQAQAEKDSRLQERIAQRQRRLEELQKRRFQAMKPPASEVTASPVSEATAEASPVSEATTSPTPSPTPQ